MNYCENVIHDLCYKLNWIVTDMFFM